ncbi:hypothetical protein ACIQGO_11475 [Streptomyces shenzhenensis]
MKNNTSPAEGPAGLVHTARLPLSIATHLDVGAFDSVLRRAIEDGPVVL